MRSSEIKTRNNYEFSFSLLLIFRFLRICILQAYDLKSMINYVCTSELN